MDKLDKVKEVLEKRKEKVNQKDGKTTYGKVSVVFYREGAYRTQDGEKVPMGGAQNGNYDRICKNLDIPDDDPSILADCLEVLSEDIATGRLKYVKEPETDESENSG